MNAKLVNLSNPIAKWDTDVLNNIENKVKAYAKSHIEEADTVEVVEVEDETWSDKINKRYNVTIKYMLNGKETHQLLLYLKGELLDGPEFHARFNEFYS